MYLQYNKLPLYGSFFTFFTCLSHFDIGMFVLRSSISVQVSNKIFGIINKTEGPNKHWGVGKSTSRRNVYLELKCKLNKLICWRPHEQKY